MARAYNNPPPWFHCLFWLIVASFMVDVLALSVGAILAWFTE